LRVICQPPDKVSCGQTPGETMTRNRTAVDIFAALGTDFIVVLLVMLAMGLAVSRYFCLAGEQMRRVEAKIRKRDFRRFAA
jgi:hypothetical protein